MPMLNVVSFLAMLHVTVCMETFVHSYTVTKQTKSAQPTVCQLRREQFVECNMATMDLQLKAGVTRNGSEIFDIF